MNISLKLADFAAISPLLILLFGSLVILLMESFAEAAAKKWSFALSVLTLALALWAASASFTSDNPLLANWLRFDVLSRLFSLFFILIGIGTVFLSKPFFQRFEATHGEYYFLVLSAVSGLILIGAAADFLTIFLGLEILSISLYVLCGYMKKWKNSSEASIKYLLLGALATAFLLYGIALIYGAVGTTHLAALMSGFQKLEGNGKILFLGGAALVTLGLAFKAAIVPFHAWAPDVYEGAPTPVTAFMAVGTKVGAFAAFVRIFMEALPHFDPLWNEGIALLAYPTLIYANFVAMRQVQLRRFFAYSGIAHAGYLIIPLAAETPGATAALLFYLAVYALATLGAFAVLSFLDNRSEGVVLHDLYGLFQRAPVLAGILAFCLLTLAGIPPTAGFFAKFYLFKVGFEAGYYALVVVGLLATIFSAYYYLRIAALMLSETPPEMTKPKRSWTAEAVGGLACAAILILSCYPGPFIAFLSE